MKFANKTIEYQTKKEYDFIDVTEDIKKFIKETGIKNGICNIQLMHTSCALIVNENEPLLIEDFKRTLEQAAPKVLIYQHDDMEHRTVNVCENECINGHAHCKAIRLLPSVTLNLINGELQLGRWQSVMLVELDRARPRRIQVIVMGE